MHKCSFSSFFFFSRAGLGATERERKGGPCRRIICFLLNFFPRYRDLRRARTSGSCATDDYDSTAAARTRFLINEDVSRLSANRHPLAGHAETCSRSSPAEECRIVLIPFDVPSRTRTARVFHSFFFLLLSAPSRSLFLLPSVRVVITPQISRVFVRAA